MNTPHSPSPAAPIVELAREDGSRARGFLVETRSDATDALVTVDFARNELLSPPVGASVAVRLGGGALPTDETLTGEVVFSSLDGTRRRLQLRFADEAHRSLAPLVNQRSAVRVRPSTAMPVKVLLTSPVDAEEYAAEVLNISGTGMSVRVTHEAEEALRSTWDPRLTIHLPTQLAPFALRGRIRHRRLDGQGVVYGISYQAGEGRGYSNLQERIYRYVMTKHVQDLARDRCTKGKHCA